MPKIKYKACELSLCGVVDTLCSRMAHTFSPLTLSSLKEVFHDCTKMNIAVSSYSVLASVDFFYRFYESCSKSEENFKINKV